MTDEPEYRSRDFEPAAHDSYVNMLLQGLAEAAARTDPSKGPTSAKGKDQEAFEALQTAGELVDAVAGWAIDHICGLSLTGESMLPLQPHNAQESVEYKQSLAAADRHDHERAGSKLHGDRPSLTADQKRTLLRNLLFCGSGGGPEWFRFESFQALDALAFGETVPMLARARKHAGDKVRYQERHLQLRLIALARFRSVVYGKGKVGLALDLVAKRAGVDRETLRTWEKRLPRDLGALVVGRTIEFARNSASHMKHALEKERQNDPKDPLTVAERASMKWFEALYGVKALDRAAEDYIEFRKMEKSMTAP